MIPGMGADGRLFGPQAAAGLRFEICELTRPNRGQSLPDYARSCCVRMALDAPCVLVGVSFGGMLALEMARCCPAEAVMLVASCCRRSAIPSRYHYLELISRLLPSGLIRRRAEMSGRILARLERTTPEVGEVVVAMARDVDVAQLRRIARMIMRWRPGLSLPCPIHQINGSGDRIIPISGVRPDEVVQGGGHLINMTHADQVNHFIAERSMQPLEPAELTPEKL